MEPSVERLVDAGVFAVTDGGDLRTTEAFDDATATHRATLADRDPDGVRAALAELTDDPTAAAALSEAADPDHGLLARYVAVGERVADLSPVQRLALATAVGHADDPPRADGAPAAFLPVGGEDLVRLVALAPRCVVFAWRDNCTPCETVREDLDDLFADERPDDLLLLAVYGPDCPRLLDEAFDVVGAPTTLFTLGGGVDARLVGAATREALSSEVTTLRERSLPTP
jgi:hypothetical protein